MDYCLACRAVDGLMAALYGVFDLAGEHLEEGQILHRKIYYFLVDRNIIRVTGRKEG